MKSALYIIFISFSLMASSCKKVIDLNLRPGDTKYVVEGFITNEQGMCKVWLSETKPFDENNEFPGVSGAVVKMKDNGIEFNLTETLAGVYENTFATGKPGHQYQLSVAINGHTFTASSVMPESVKLDTMFVSRGPFGQFKFPTVRYTDPPGKKNYYRFVQFVNNIKDPAIFFENDEFTDGEKVSLQLDGGVNRKDDPRAIHTGDEVMVEMHCLDSAVYKYWYTLRTEGGDGSSNVAAPANPVSNIMGGALGYFSAHTVDRRKVIAP